MNKAEVSANDLCLLCGEFMGNFKKSTNEATNFTKSTVECILGSLISPDIQQIQNSFICQNCFIKLNELDEHQMIADKIRSDIIQVYNSLSSNKVYPEVKIEILDIPIDNEEVKNESLSDDNYRDDDDDEYEEPKKKTRRLATTKATKSEGPKKRKPGKNKQIRARLNKSGKTREEMQTEPLNGAELLKHNGKLMWRCKTCQKIDLKRCHMAQHVMIHKPERTVCCHDCGKMFKTLRCLYTHRRYHRKIKMKECDLCGKSFDKRFFLVEHMNATHLMVKKYICSVCGQSFARKSSLNNHGLVHLTSTNKRYSCEVCGLQSNLKSTVQRHMKTHTGEKNHACEICQRRFANRYNMLAHIKVVHEGIKPKVDESKLTCVACGKRYPRQRQLRRHLYEAHGMEEYAAEFNEAAK